MDYGEVLSRAWRIIWKHKILWIFGIMAGCSTGNGGNFNFQGSRSDFEGSSIPQIEQFFNQITPEVLTLIIAGFICLILLLIVLAVFLGITGQIGLYRGASIADQETDTRLRFGELFRGSLPFFWRIFLLGLLVFAAVLVAVIVIVLISIPIAVLTLGIGLVCLIPLLCLLIPAGAALQVVVEQSQIAIVVENLGVMDGLRRGWEVVRSNPVTMLVMWLILNLGIGLIAGIVLSLPMLLALIPFLVSVFQAGELEWNALAITTLVCIVAYLPVLIVLSGALTSYIKTAWTLTFLRLTRSPAALDLPAVPPIEPGPAPEPGTEIFTA